MKLGTKLKRIKRNSKACYMSIGKTYTYAGIKNGWIMLAEKKYLGYCWDINNFELVN